MQRSMLRGGGSVLSLRRLAAFSTGNPRVVAEHKRGSSPATADRLEHAKHLLSRALAERLPASHFTSPLRVTSAAESGALRVVMDTPPDANATAIVAAVLALEPVRAWRALALEPACERPEDPTCPKLFSAVLTDCELMVSVRLPYSLEYRSTKETPMMALPRLHAGALHFELDKLQPAVAAVMAEAKCRADSSLLTSDDAAPRRDGAGEVAEAATLTAARAKAHSVCSATGLQVPKAADGAAGPLAALTQMLRPLLTSEAGGSGAAGSGAAAVDEGATRRNGSAISASEVVAEGHTDAAFVKPPSAPSFINPRAAAASAANAATFDQSALASNAASLASNRAKQPTPTPGTPGSKPPTSVAEALDFLDALGAKVILPLGGAAEEKEGSGWAALAGGEEIQRQVGLVTPRPLLCTALQSCMLWVHASAVRPL